MASFVLAPQQLETPEGSSGEAFVALECRSTAPSKVDYRAIGRIQAYVSSLWKTLAVI
jgi:hypothetical protein